MRLEVKSGASRTTILMWRWAFKIPNVQWGWSPFLKGLLHNMSEKTWTDYDNRLCPVLWGVPGGFLNIMPRCEPLLPHEEYLIFRRVRDLNIELKPCSFGRLNGEIVAVDYGICCAGYPLEES